MESKLGFTKLTLAEFEAWIKHVKVGRTIRTLQQHHTYLPNYSHFRNNNHFEIQQGMERHHVHSNGWSAIGQHFTTFPDGSIMTGRTLEKSPACIYGFNSNSICMEHLGDFDKGNDQMTDAQKKTIIHASAAITQKFKIPVNTDKIVYHHWFSLSTGQRNDGTGGNKSCPGTSFFGGNKVIDAQKYFIPEIKKALGQKPTNEPDTPLLKYVTVTASRLNIRTGPGTNHKKASDRDPIILGSILRVYQEEEDWFKISSSSEHWVSARYTKEVFPATVNASKLNARSGPSTNYSRVGSYARSAEVWIEEIDGGWAKINAEEKWVSKQYLTF